MAGGKPTLQHLNNSQSQQILWLLEELGIEYNLNLFERETTGARKNRAPIALTKTHPLGKSPQLITSEGRVIIERSAIARYLIDTYDTAGKFKIDPNDTENDVIREEELLSFGGASFGATLMIAMIFTFLAKGSPFFIRPVVSMMGTMVNKGFLNKEIETMTKYLDDGLAGKTFFMGTSEPTRVDFCMLWHFDLGVIAGHGDLTNYSHLKAWYDRCKARPAWKRSLEKGNGYALNIDM